VAASDLDARAVSCAAANGVEVYRGDLFAPLPRGLAGRVDVVVAVVPYVPAGELAFLQRDTFRFESRLAYDGGVDGLDVVRRAAAEASRWLRPRGALLLELGGDQGEAAGRLCARLGYRDIALITDSEGDLRGLTASWR
jgi:release factor glutamine methyltransferase